jgi:DNA (cytosine-5)-methyltransferase 1
MRHGSLFSGIGGFDLAAEWMGWENVFHCEWNEFGQKVLNYYWPKAECFKDITKSDFTKYNGTIDIISGGFPCQPYSVAGKRKGKEDERHLWPEMLRTIREVQPRWIVGENVPGLVNWERGLVLNEIKTDLENEGFTMFPPVIIPACAKDAPHRRDRLWIIAHSCKINGKQATTNRGWESSEQIEERGAVWSKLTPISESWDVANTNNEGIQRREASRNVGKDWKESNELVRGCFERNDWYKFPTQSPVRTGNDGLPTDMDTSTFSKSKWNEESLKAAGNAIVPQVAFEIFKAIQSFENL